MRHQYPWNIVSPRCRTRDAVRLDEPRDLRVADAVDRRQRGQRERARRSPTPTARPAGARGPRPPARARPAPARAPRARRRRRPAARAPARPGASAAASARRVGVVAVQVGDEPGDGPAGAGRDDLRQRRARRRLAERREHRARVVAADRSTTVAPSASSSTPAQPSHVSRIVRPRVACRARRVIQNDRSFCIVAAMPRRSAADVADSRASAVEAAVDLASVEGLEGITIGRLAGELDDEQERPDRALRRQGGACSARCSPPPSSASPTRSGGRPRAPSPGSPGSRRSSTPGSPTCATASSPAAAS